MMAEQYCMVITTVADKETARTLTKALLDAKLAACVQWLDIHSFYTFEGQSCDEPEIMLLLKSRRSLYDRIEALLKKEHPYKVPEILLIPVENGLQDYLSWIDAETDADL